MVVPFATTYLKIDTLVAKREIANRHSIKKPLGLYLVPLTFCRKSIELIKRNLNIAFIAGDTCYLEVLVTWTKRVMNLCKNILIGHFG